MGLNLSTGAEFAGYRIEELVGRGGMGIVYRALQLTLERPVALKLIVPEHAADEEFRSRFKRESRLAAQLDHPNVIPVHEAGEAGGLLFISMRYVDGTDLRERLLEEGRLRPERAARITAQVAGALDAAHERGLVHRDVKPANVLLQGSGASEHAYLTDFGLTKSTSSESGLTQSGKWVGTLDYAAPEQLKGDRLDSRTDVYALGCLLYQLLTGRVPYPRGSDAAKLWAHVSEPPPVPSAAAPDLPAEIDQVVARAMAKDPARRYRSAGDLGRAALAVAGGALPPSEQGSVAAGAAAPLSGALVDQGAATKGATVTDRGHATGGPAGAGAPTARGREPPSSVRPELRRIVTVAFCEATHSSDIGEHIDPESLHRIMSRAREVMRSALEHHGGTVQSYLGDAVMAVFGIPTLHEDDALRAVRAVDELREALARLNEELGAAWSVGLEVRAGLNTGEVVTGDPARGQPMLAGDAVNLATRLEQAAAIGEVLIGPDTYRLVRGAVKAEPVEPLTIPGKPEPVLALTLGEVDKGALGVPRRMDSSMVGRGPELAMLEAAFRRAVDERGCQLATVLGPAGVGKSRLTQEFIQGLGDQARTLVGRCLSYGEGITFWPVAEVVRDAAEITEEDSPYEKRSKITALLPEDEDARHIVECVAGALGISEAASPPEEISWAIRKLLEALARERPLVVVFDDIQWGETTFLDLIEYVAGFSSGFPILVVCMARPELAESRPSLASSAGTRLPLEPLDVAASETLMENLLGEGQLAPEVSRRIAAAAEGNPLFLEEMVHMLVDDGLLERENGSWRAVGDLSAVTAPPTIQALISARLDRLDQGELAVLERGAVIGHEFWRGAVRNLLPEPSRSELGYHLDTCVRKKLVRPGGREFAGEDAYRFTHLLIREVTYQTLLKGARSELHERFAAWLEERAGQRSGEYDELIGFHLEQSFRSREALGPVDERARRLAQRAAKRLGDAGARASARGDMPAAANLLGRAESLLPPDEPARREVLLKLGIVLCELGDISRAEVLLGETAEAAAAAGDRRLEALALLERSYWRLGTSSGGSTDELRRVAERAVSALEEVGDEAGLARAWRYLAFVDSIACRSEVTAESLERALLHARRAGDVQQETELLTWLIGALQYGPAPVEEGIRRLHEILDPAVGARGAATPRLSANARAFVEATGLAGLEAMRGNLEEARMFAGRAKAILEELGQTLKLAVQTQESGWVELLAGSPAAAEAELRRSYEMLEEMGEKGYLSTTAGLLGEAIYSQGRYREAFHMTEVCEQSAALDDLVSQILWRGTRAKVHVREGNLEPAERLAREAVSLASDTDDLNLHADRLTDLAEVLGLAGRAREAADAVSEALELYGAKGNVVSSRKANALLEELGR